MGMAASQVRYLTLTARIHDVENQAQRIQNQKLLLANNSDEVYQRYLNALEKTKMQVRQFDDDSGTSQMIDVTLDVLYRESCSTLTNGYMLTGTDGSLYLPFSVETTDVSNFNNFEQRCANYFYYPLTGTTALDSLRENTQKSDYVKAMWRYINEQAGADMFYGYNSSDPYMYISDDTRVTLHAPSGQASPMLDRHAVIHCITDESNVDTDWIRDIIGYGYANFQMLSADLTETSTNGCTVSTLNGGDWYVATGVDTVSMRHFNSSTVSTDTQMSEVADEIELAKAEVEYESDMKKINAKDKKYDTELSTLENQRSAMKEQLDSMKTVIKDNIDRTFKIFNG